MAIEVEWDGVAELTVFEAELAAGKDPKASFTELVQAYGVMGVRSILQLAMHAVDEKLRLAAAKELVAMKLALDAKQPARDSLVSTQHEMLVVPDSPEGLTG